MDSMLMDNISYNTPVSFMINIFTASLAMHKLTQTRNTDGWTQYKVNYTNKNSQLPSEHH